MLSSLALQDQQHGNYRHVLMAIHHLLKTLFNSTTANTTMEGIKRLQGLNLFCDIFLPRRVCSTVQENPDSHEEILSERDGVKSLSCPIRRLTFRVVLKSWLMKYDTETCSYTQYFSQKRQCSLGYEVHIQVTYQKIYLSCWQRGDSDNRQRKTFTLENTDISWLPIQNLMNPLYK